MANDKSSENILTPSESASESSKQTVDDSLKNQQASTSKPAARTAEEQKKLDRAELSKLSQAILDDWQKKHAKPEARSGFKTLLLLATGNAPEGFAHVIMSELRNSNQYLDLNQLVNINLREQSSLGMEGVTEILFHIVAEHAGISPLMAADAKAALEDEDPNAKVHIDRSSPQTIAASITQAVEIANHGTEPETDPSADETVEQRLQEERQQRETGYTSPTPFSTKPKKPGEPY